MRDQDDNSVEEELQRVRKEREELRRLVEELQKRNTELEKENDKLREELEAARNAAKRQAAPFRRPKDKRARAPRPPGRRPGHPGSYRPRPSYVDEEVKAPLDECPHCGSEVFDVESVEQFVEDLPEIRPRVCRILTHKGRCRKCGEVRSHHPRQVSQATGAAQTQLGPRLLGVAVDLNKRCGLTTRQTCDVLRRFFGVQLSPGGLVQAEARLAERLRPAYAELRDELRSSHVVYADETSWWVNGPGWWLWVFSTEELTFFTVEESRGSDIVEDTLGTSFSGILSSDCLQAYDRISCRKNKCYAHHLRAISDALKTCPDSEHLRGLQLLLKTALALGASRGDCPSSSFRKLVANLEKSADKLLARPASHPAERRIVNRLRKQRPHLFTFLHYEGIDATNNRAERDLRPAVIARKLSCGNRTLRGKETWEVLASLATTCEKQGLSFADWTASAVPLDAAVPTLLPNPPPA